MNPETVQSSLSELIPWITKYGLQVLGAVVILVIGRIVSSAASGAVRKAMTRANSDPTLRNFVASLVGIAILAFAVIAALAKFGIQTTSFVAVLGAAGFAVGLALQGSLANFASGVMMLIFRPIKVGDLVEASGYLGIVEEVGIFVTTMNTLDHQRVIIPNATLTSGVINNVNGNGIRRVDLTVGVSYGDDLEKAKRIAREILDLDHRVLKDPAASVGVFQLADSAVELVVRPWVQAEHYWDVWFDTTQALKEKFAANGITMPFPQRDVHMRNVA
ncbi:MAG: mechanosensitive ion channel [Gemmatimonadetes bacterium]|nr:mechanosensitive ion channel [Gemmatimonadota bacterium]